MENLNIIEHLLDEKERVKTSIKPVAICLHHTAGWDNPINTVKCWNKDKIGRIGTHYVIGGQNVKGIDNSNDGKVIRCIPDIGWNAWHLGGGPKNQNMSTVGIEICSAGALKTTGSSPIKKTWFGVEAHPDQVCRLNSAFRGTSFYHRYSDKQLTATKQVLLHLANLHSIDITEGIVSLLKTQTITKAFEANRTQGDIAKGLYSHTNFRVDKSDCFPQPEFIDMLLSI